MRDDSHFVYRQNLWYTGLERVIRLDVMQAMRNRRSMRRFLQKSVSKADLFQIMEAARLAPTGMNRQPVRFAAVTGPALCKAIFPHIDWAMLIPDGSAGPTEATMPAAYIAILLDKTIHSGHTDTDAGAAGMSILLAAESLGIGACWLGSLRRGKILSLLGQDAERYALHTMVALGYPAMRSRAVSLQGDNTDYYLESPDALCVPKRAAEDVMVWYE